MDALHLDYDAQRQSLHTFTVVCSGYLHYIRTTTPVRRGRYASLVFMTTLCLGFSRVDQLDAKHIFRYHYGRHETP